MTATRSVKTLVAETGTAAVRDLSIQDSGGVFGGYVPEVNRGRSTAPGPGCRAEGDLIFASGVNVVVTADSSVASGVAVTVEAGFCVATGYNFIIEEAFPYCSVRGTNVVCEGQFACLDGYEAEVYANGGIAYGAGAQVQENHDRAVALGQNSVSVEADSVSVGSRKIESTSNERSLVTRTLKGDRYHRTINHYGRSVQENLFGGSGFDPRDATELVNWWKASEVSTTHKEFDPSKLRADHGDIIKMIDGKEGTYNWLGSATGSPPVLHHDVFNGKQAAYYDGTVQSAAGLHTNSATATIFIVFKPMATAGDYILFYSDDNARQLLVADADDTTNPPSWLSGTPTYRLNGVDVDFSTRAKFSAGTNNRLCVLTMENVDLSGWPQTSTGLRVANTPSAGYEFKGYFGEMLVCNAALTTNLRNAFEAYLMNEYITTLRNSYYWDGPTFDPEVAGQIYCDAADDNVFKMSAG
jgi:hypothetical protein